MLNIDVRPIKTNQELEDMYYQRWLVLRDPLGMERGTEKDKYDTSAFHLVAVYNDTVIGSARLRELSEGLGSIAYVCVLNEFHNRGIGTTLIEELIEKAKEKNLRTLRVMTRLDALKFYKKLGFSQTGESFNYLDIPHLFMYLTLPSPLTLDGDFLPNT
ncbi:MAG: GNAT family N-acetyltransferase [Coleofasciculus sp. S288]|nr:GNAT family N-acetyltransferase [Coleofasciculus sp. S288]